MFLVHHIMDTATVIVIMLKNKLSIIYILGRQGAFKTCLHYDKIWQLPNTGYWNSSLNESNKSPTSTRQIFYFTYPIDPKHTVAYGIHLLVIYKLISWRVINPTLAVNDNAAITGVLYNSDRMFLSSEHLRESLSLHEILERLLDVLVKEARESVLYGSKHVWYVWWAYNHNA